MKTNKNLLKRSKIVRALQLLELAKENKRISEKKYEKLVEKYKQKLDSIVVDPSQEANYLKSLSVPEYLDRERIGQNENVSQDILGGVAIKIFIAVVAFFAVAYFFPYAIKLLTVEPVYLFIAIGCPLLYLLVVYLLDKYEPEPKMFVIGAFLWGCISTAIALMLNVQSAGIFGVALSICLAGFTEEFAKGIGLYHISKNPEYNDTLDAIVYGFAIGLGFAAVENIFYYYKFTSMMTDRAGDLYGNISMMIVVRASLCALGHAVFTTTIGIVLAQAKQKKGMPDIGDFVVGYILAAFIHGAFNYFCLAIGNYSIAVNSVIVVVGLLIFWMIIKNNWLKMRGWGWHVKIK